MVCAEQIAKRFVSCKGRTDDFGLAKQKGRLVAARVSAGPRHEEKVIFVFRILSCALQTWQRPTLPRLKTKYHRRWGVSRPCSEWERVQPPRQNHQVGKAQDLRLADANRIEKLVSWSSQLVLF